MLIMDRRKFFQGFIMACGFFAVIILMFAPLFNGQNALKGADRLFNSIAKGSTYYIPGLLEDSKKYIGKTFDVSVTMKNEEVAAEAVKMLQGAGTTVVQNGAQLSVKGDMGKLFSVALRDSDSMFLNKGDEIKKLYGFNEREVLYTWWLIFQGIEKQLIKKELFAEAAAVKEVAQKGIEVGYNFYEIIPEKASEKVGILGFSLVFYVVYTFWWGYAILFLFEGLGLKMKAGAKKEV